MPPNDRTRIMGQRTALWTLALLPISALVSISESRAAPKKNLWIPIPSLAAPNKSLKIPIPPVPPPSQKAPRKRAKAPKISPLPKFVLERIEKRNYEGLIDGLRGQTSDWNGRRPFLFGYAYLKMGRYRDAVFHLKRALRQAPDLKGYILHFMAKASLAAGDDEAARKTLEKRVRLGRAGPRGPFSLETLARLELKEGRPLRAANWLRELVRRFPDHEKAATFIARRAEALDRAGKTRDAALVWRRIWLRYPESAISKRGLARSRALGQNVTPPLRPIGPRDHFLRARHLQKANHHEKALNGFRELNRLFPDSPFRRQSALYSSFALFALRKTVRAANALAASLHLVPPGSPNRMRIRFYLSRNHLRRHDQPAFEMEARALLEETPEGIWAARTRYLLARVSEDDKNFETAVRYYREVIQKHPYSPHALKARWQLSWIRFQKKEYPEAFRGFEEMERLYLNHRLASSALFWGAVSAQRSGEREKAQALFRKSAQKYRHRYYGQLSRKALRRMAKKTGLPSKPLPLPAAGYRDWLRPPSGSVGQASLPGWRAAEILASMGFHLMAAEEFKRMGPARYFRFRAARSYFRGGRNDMAIRIMHKSFWDAVRSGGKDLPREFWKIVFPLHPAKKRPGDADPLLVNAIIRAESLFDRRAFSRAGAIGLMQIMPATGRQLSKKLKIRLQSSDKLFDPKLNVRLGARYLGDLVSEFKGALVPAIASYNAGKRVAKKWWRTRGEESIESFVERIPYQETRNYVKKVLGYYREYQRIYAPSQTSTAHAGR